ncbi:hypothetical protein [Acinetobacter sp. SM34]
MANAQNNNVTVDTGLQATLNLLSQRTANGSALNLAINTNNIDATVNTSGRYNELESVGNTIAVETSALGAVNTGSISLQQGNLTALNTGTVDATLDAERSAARSLEEWRSERSSEFESSISTSLNTDTYDQFSETLSNYSAANLAINTGAIDASVNSRGFENHIEGIKTSAIGAVNTGSITVTVK